MSVAAAVSEQIQRAGGSFMFSREAKDFAASTGVEGFLGGYVRGRGGVLGEVDADVVYSAFGFLPLSTIRSGWDSTAAIPAAKAAEGYLGACQDFGRRKLASFEAAPRLAELLEAVVLAADSAGAALFAGWRAMPLAADAPARVLHLAHTLRELRGGLHLMAIRASGLTPLEAVVIKGSPFNDGPGQAAWFGWQPPFPEITPDVRARWDRAEALTDEMISPAFAVLDAEAGAELVALVSACHDTIFAPR
ncbi:SCO6745 family protein [Nocardia goodfellowii]